MRYLKPLPILLVLAAVLYLSTWSPALTWEHYGEDGPELEAAGRTLGVPHPTGYPLLMLIVRVVSLAAPPPVSALNLVTLLAAVAAVGAAGMAGRALGRRVWGPDSRWADAAGLLGGAIFATSLTWWKQAVIGEVYTLHIFLVAATLALVFTGGTRRALLAVWLMGLGLAHHLQTVPFILVVIAYAIMGRRRRPHPLMPVLLLAPLSLYLVLVIRSRMDPAFDWGNPETLRSLWWTMSGAPYRGNLFSGGWEMFGPRLLDAAIHGPVAQIGAAGAALAVAGWMAAAVRARREAVALALLFAGTQVVAAAYAIPDSAAYYLPGVLALALSAGLGGAWLLERAVRAGRRAGRWKLAPAAGVAGGLAALFAVHTAGMIPRADVSRLDGASDYARAGMAALAPDALVLAHGDGRTFALWYGAAVLRPRPDVVVLYDNLLDWPWYRDFVARRYPGVGLPPPGLSRPVMRGAMIERHLDERPVYVTELEPELAHLFRTEPAGPLYRVSRRPPPDLTGAASTGRTSMGDRPSRPD